jgi:hypothetical protein
VEESRGKVDNIRVGKLPFSVGKLRAAGSGGFVLHFLPSSFVPLPNQPDSWNFQILEHHNFQFERREKGLWAKSPKSATLAYHQPNKGETHATDYQRISRLPTKIIPNVERCL